LVSVIHLTGPIVDRHSAQGDIALRNTPLWVGEWSLYTEFNMTDDFPRKWADAQKMMYSQDAGGWCVPLSKMAHRHNIAPCHSSGTSNLRRPMASCHDGKGFYIPP